MKTQKWIVTRYMCTCYPVSSKHRRTMNNGMHQAQAYYEQWYAPSTCILWTMVCTMHRCTMNNSMQHAQAYYEQWYAPSTYILWTMVCIMHRCTMNNSMQHAHAYYEQWYAPRTCILGGWKKSWGVQWKGPRGSPYFPKYLLHSVNDGPIFGG